MSKYFDYLETRAPEVRERALFKALGEQLANAKKNAKPKLYRGLNIVSAFTLGRFAAGIATDFRSAFGGR